MISAVPLWERNEGELVASDFDGFSEAEFVQPERENRFDFFYERTGVIFLTMGFLLSYMDAAKGERRLNGAANRGKFELTSGESKSEY